MTQKEKSTSARERYKRIKKRFETMREQQPLATKNAILTAIAYDEGITTTTVLRALSFCEQ